MHDPAAGQSAPPFDGAVLPARVHLLADDGCIPNSRLPLLPGILQVTAVDPAGAFERVFAANGWNRSWRNGIYPFDHYHSTAHEVLGICAGQADVRFGGSKGITLTLRPGDGVVIPAGVGHRRLTASADLLVVGAYPPGPEEDLCRGELEGREKALRNIARVPLPATDPFCGRAGPLVDLWSRTPNGEARTRPNRL